MGKQVLVANLLYNSLYPSVRQTVCNVISVAAYTNNETNSEKNHETYMRLSAVVVGQHIVKLTTSPSAPQILV